MAWELASGLNGPTSSPSQGHCDTTYIQRGVKIFIHVVTSCNRNQNKLQPDGPLGLYADLALYYTLWKVCYNYNSQHMLYSDLMHCFQDD